MFLFRIILILPVIFSLCAVPLCPDFQVFKETKQQKVSSNLHTHSHDDVKVADHEHDSEEHVHHHSHGPGEPEHEHAHDHSSSPASAPFPPLAENLVAVCMLEPDGDINRFPHVEMTISCDGFLKEVYRPPIVFA